MTDNTAATAQNNTQAGAGGTGDGAGATGGGTALTGAQAAGQKDGKGGDAGNATGDGKGGAAGNAAAGAADGGTGGAQPAAFDASKLTLPDGWTMNEGLLKDFTPLAQSLKLTQEGAQQLVNLQVAGIEGYQKQQLDAYTKQVDGWMNGLKTDTVVGGEKMLENFETAKKAIDKFGDPELQQLLNPWDAQKNPNGMGLGNHPALVRAFFKIGQLISEDNFGKGGAGAGGGEVDAATKLYGPGTETKPG